jgi:hypothetical protein
MLHWPRDLLVTNATLGYKIPELVIFAPSWIDPSSRIWCSVALFTMSEALGIMDHHHVRDERDKARQQVLPIRY